MHKVKSKKTKAKNVIEMPIVNLYSAGIDISDKEHMLAVPEVIAIEGVRSFGTMTCDLVEIIRWLQDCEIETVAMESTGVYGKPLFTMLTRNGFEVYLVNANHVKNVSGRKTDENNAMWIQKLHSCGLLKTSYLPDDEQESLRTLVRYRRTLLQDCSRFRKGSTKEHRWESVILLHCVKKMLQSKPPLQSTDKLHSRTKKSILCTNHPTLINLELPSNNKIPQVLLPFVQRILDRRIANS
ncbi:MAG: hypothetical protein C5B59_00390 [Bacteroidetes bacterium]|nr:MAG: hypothetical protein C5B59_00390 [Bacteroidota bacterium]